VYLFVSGLDDKKKIEVGRLLEVLEGNFTSFTSRVHRMLHDPKDTEAYLSTQLIFDDCMGAMTGNIYGRGHSNGYYRQNSNRHASEMFANYVCLTQGPNGAAFKKLLHTISPLSCKGFDAILARRASGSPN